MVLVVFCIPTVLLKCPACTQSMNETSVDGSGGAESIVHTHPNNLRMISTLESFRPIEMRRFGFDHDDDDAMNQIQCASQIGAFGCSWHSREKRANRSRSEGKPFHAV